MARHGGYPRAMNPYRHFIGEIETALRAMQALEVLPESPHRDALWALAEQLLDRRS